MVHAKAIRKDEQRNVFLMMSAQAIDSIISALTYVMVGRLLGPSAMGLWSAVMSASAITFGFVNIAVNVPVSREVARNRRIATQYIDVAWAVILVLTVPLTLGLNLTAGWTLGFRDDSLTAMLLAAAGMALGSFTTLWLSVLFAIERFDVYLKLVAIFRATGLLLMLGLLQMFPHVLTVMAVTVLVNTAYALTGLAIVRRTFGRIRPRWDFQLARQLVAEALPVTFASVMASIGLRADSVMMERLRGATEAGIYSAAYSVYMFGAVVVFSATVALFPRFAKASDRTCSDIPQFEQVFLNSGQYVVAFGIFAAVVGLGVAPWILRLLYGLRFADSRAPLQILMLAIPFLALNRLGYQALNASNRQNMTFIATALGAGFNVASNLILIPRWGYIAASWTTVITEAIMAGAFTWFVLVIPHYSRLTVQSVPPQKPVGGGLPSLTKDDEP